MALGIVWHSVVVLLMGEPLANAVSVRMLAGAAAGLCAGCLTVWSRTRHHGRESIVDGLVTYYAAVVTYAFALIVIGAVGDCCAGDKALGLLDCLAATFAMASDAVWFASIMGVVLIPLCFATRYLLWRFAKRVRPDKA
jgi:hypothetical protein